MSEMQTAAMESANKPIFPWSVPTRSESIGNLVKALAAAQREYKPLKKSSVNPFYTTDKKVAKYAELADVIEATQPALAAHGLAVTQMVTTNLEEQTATVETILAHESGEWISSRLTLPAAGKGYNNTPRFDAQTIGAAFTYARRYGLQAIVEISAEPDDDGNTLVESGTKEAAQKLGQAKVAAAQAKAAQSSPQQKPSAEVGELVLDGLIVAGGVARFQTKAKQQYRKIQMILKNDETVEVNCFDNRKFPDGTSLFDLLDLIGDTTRETKRPTRARFSAVKVGGYINVKLPLLLGDTEFDSEGVPVIQRAEQFQAANDDLPEILRGNTHA